MQQFSLMRLVLAAACLLMLSSLPSAMAQARRALIIGVGDYDHLTSLEGVPQRDAAGLAGVFQDQLDFEDVTVLPDLTQNEFLTEFSAFIDRIETGDTVVFFFSGHGWSDGSENFLAFTDAPLSGTESSRRLRTVPLSQTVIQALQERAPGAVIAIIDACRNNPFADHTKSLPKGLGPIREQEGVFIAFAAGQGQTALARLPSDDQATYSLFTRHLLPRLANASRPLSRIFEEVRNEVQADAGTVPHWQRPAVYSELPLDYCFSGSCRGALDAESSLWLTAAALSGDAEACGVYADYLSQYPEGKYTIAARRLAAMPPCAQAPVNTGYQTMSDADTGGRLLTIGLGEPLDKIDDRKDLVCAEARATVYFDYDSGGLNPEAIDTLSRFIAYQDCTISRVIIEGHDDGTFVNEDGTLISPEYAVGVSARRARAVADYLMVSGVPGEAIITHAYGTSRPAIPGGAAAFNRRVEVSVIYQ